jgi:ABC-type sugar transport system ATPase subunit
MDEPLSSLDRGLREEMTSEIRRLQSETGVTVIYVTHDQAEALTLSNRVGVLGGGRLLQFDSPSVVHERPVSPYVARLVGSMNIERVEYAGEIANDCIRVRLGRRAVVARGSTERPGQPVIGVRPYRLQLHRAFIEEPGMNALEGTLLSASLTGSGVLCQVDVGLSAPWEAVLQEPLEGIAPGMPVRLAWPHEATVLMSAE